VKEKETTLVILAVIAILAIIGLLLLFNSAKTGAGFVAKQSYPQEYKDNPFPYYRDALHTLGVQKRDFGQIDWDWRRRPDRTYGALKGRCSILATYEMGIVPQAYTWDANYQQSRGKDCLQVEESLKGFCCVPPESP